MHSIELDDWGRFGKVRQAREKDLADPDDVFMHAEQRRKEFADAEKSFSPVVATESGAA